MMDLTRRTFLQRLYQGALALGAGQLITLDDLIAAEAKPLAQRPNLIWLHGSSCTGCSCSFLDEEEISVAALITRFMRVVFHPDISSATGAQVPEIIEGLISAKAPFYFLFEGGLPVGLPHACMMSGQPMTHWVRRLAGAAAACVAVGTCAALGGIPKMTGTLTGSATLSEFFEAEGIKTPLINLPGCPAKPEHMTFTLLHLATRGGAPPRDERGRPRALFGRTIHERCIRYADFQEGRFAADIGEEGCLLKLGCQGPITYTDCMTRGHNGNTNTCIRAGHPCVGCASERFPRRFLLHSSRDPRRVEQEG
ncbi:hydrogenase small subunit [Myxococcota bacterium]|nr:hydrogenase small subunit [Myxococcota bacterium]